MPEKTTNQGKADKPARKAAAKPAASKSTAKATPPKSRAKPAAPKSAARKTAGAKPAEKRLQKVPEEYVFYCCDGSVFRDLAELAAGLNAMTDEVFVYHSNSEKQDFCNWVRDVIEDIELAEELAMAASRLEAAERVAERLALLSE
jgi:hypothetical protein